ncbi:hypothetical protein [Lacipirellula parvula]|uniref:PEP-CTERM protein-sorting domain-containing protein n=1 Tax=Lacipirellula parvula TaxID=2650471 RepID=A0A5K7XL02_9BACT|nr:hypothetical protein [Lacipirellula parvula]BBO33619.1 hypothetical protein PLANPX_3231 [Lacipirellula parvula]
MSLRALLRSGALLALAAWGLPPAYGIEITVDGVAVFKDNYEDGDAGAAFGPAQLGNWEFTFIGSSRVSVTDAAIPGAFEGTNYGHLVRQIGNQQSAAYARLGTDLADGAHVKATWMLYVPAGHPDYGFNGGFADNTENRGVALATSASGNVLLLNKGISWDDTGLDFSFDTWQKWEQDWVVGSNSMTITVGGNTATVNDFDSGGGAITQFYFSTVPGSSYFVDAAQAAAVPGDYNADLKVDGVDFLLWQRSFGSTVNLAADGNDNGIVDAGDLGVWKEHFGTGGSAAPTAAAIPEPSGVFLAVAGIVISSLRRQRR